MRAGGRGWNPRAGRNPLLVRHELHAEFVVEDSQIPVVSAYNSIRPDGLHFLRHYANIGFVAAVIAEAIKAEAVVEMTEQRDVVLECDVRSPSAAATTASAAATTTSTAAAAHASATPTAAAHAHAAAAPAETCVSA